MTFRLFKPLTLASMLILALVAGTLQAAPSIDVAGFGSGLSFSTDFVYEQAWLRVTGPAAYVHEQKFSSLDDLAIVLEAGATDGRYSWEILAVAPISAELRAQIDAARADGAVIDRLKRSGELRSATFFGSFELRSGLVELPTASLGADDRDVSLKQLFTQNVSIDGSLCVGNDCSASESYGSDTIRLKENNLRIHFEDTSTSSNYPSNDWRLVANSSDNNGDNYFSIVDATGGKTPFRADAGAPNDALRIKSDGKIGLRTGAPAVDVHLVTGNSPTFRLEQDGSSGFEQQTWDIVGNEVNFFIRDVTNGSKLPFKIRPQAPTDTLVLTADGYLGVNEDAAEARLHVRDGGGTHTPSNGAVLALFQRNNNSGDGSIVSVLAGSSGNAQIFLGDKDDDKAGRVIYRNASDALSLWTAGSERLFIESDGQLCLGCNNTQGDAIRHSNGAVLTAGGTWTNASSRGLKQDIAELSGAEAMAALGALEPVTYRYKAELDETYVGFIAEDVPELVAMKDRKSLTSMDVVAVLTKVVQEQQKAYDLQRISYEAQRLQLEALRARLEALESVE